MEEARLAAGEPSRVRSAVVPFAALTVALGFLAACGAGVFTRALCLVAIALSSAYAFCAWPRTARGAGRAEPERGSASVERVCLLILLLLLVTLVPLPLALTRLTGAERYRQNAAAAQALQQAADLNLVEAVAPTFAFTRNRAGTMRIAALAIVMIGCGMLAARMAPRARPAFLRTVVLGGAAIGVAGCVALRYMPQGDTLWWVIPIRHDLPGPVACFINRNHFGGLMALLAPAAIALTITDLAHRRWLRGLLAGCCFVVLTAAVIDSRSRGAFVAYLAGLLAAPVALATTRRPLLGIVLGVLLCAAAGAALTARNPILRERLATFLDPSANESLQARLAAWQGTIRICGAYPVAGAGPNAFRMVYPQFRVESTRGFRTHAENEYVQLLAETGIAGACLCMLLVVLYLRSANSAERPSGGANVLAMAAAGAAAAAAMHAMGDFALHSPLYAAVFAALLGLALPPPSSTSTRYPWTALLCLGGALALYPAHAGMQRLDSSRDLRPTDIREIQDALLWAPTSRDAWSYLGWCSVKTGGTNAHAFAERCLAQAAAYDPKDYLTWLDLGSFRLQKIKDYPGARAAFGRVRELRTWVELPRVPEK
jgi:O-antigen ligase